MKSRVTFRASYYRVSHSQTQKSAFDGHELTSEERTNILYNNVTIHFFYETVFVNT